MEKLTVTPIGYVRNGATPEIRSEEFRHLISDIVIEPEYADGLMDIEENEFLTIVFYFDRNDGEYRLRLHPRGDPSRPITGVFNTRSQFPAQSHRDYGDKAYRAKGQYAGCRRSRCAGRDASAGHQASCADL